MAPSPSSSRWASYGNVWTRRLSVATERRYHGRRTVAVAQLVEPRVVVPVVAGSSPVRHPGWFLIPRRTTRRGVLEQVSDTFFDLPRGWEDGAMSAAGLIEIRRL